MIGKQDHNNNIITSNNNNNSEEFLDHKNNKKYKTHKHHQKTGNRCYCLDLLEFFGPINIICRPEESKLYVSDLKLIQFDDHFDELLEKGKNTAEKSNENNKLSVPDITFWHQRYYYYSKYDDGILMDNECKILINLKNIYIFNII